MDYRKDFPFFSGDWVYLDSAATSQKPQCVIDCLAQYYTKTCATVHRAIYDLSLGITEQYEEARAYIANFLSCTPEEVIFCKGTTDGINMIARSFSKVFLKEGDTILLTEMEHHSNIVPWQLLANELNLKLKYIPVKEDKTLDLSDPHLFKGIKLLAVNHISNVTGVENQIKEICKKAHKEEVKVLVDGAQAVAHRKVNVKELGCDFYIFSGHKIYGPTGIGVIFGKKELLEKMPPVSGGGDMIEEVYLSHSTYQKPPLRFEAGTPPIAEVLGLKAAIEYVSNIGFENIQAHERKLYAYLVEKLSSIKTLCPFALSNSSSILSFSVDGVHPLDIATFLNAKKIAVRSGHLCAQPFLRKFDKTSLCRVSFGIYNTKKDIDILASCLLETLLVLQ